MSIDVRRAADRFTTTADGRTTRHSFSFDRHYDPANVGHALLVAHNDDLVAPGHGYDPHPHRDTEIVTWVLAGILAHRDTEGHGGLVTPGDVQVLSAGSGVVHSERNDAPGAREPVRFVQMWLTPTEPGLPPSYAQADTSADLAGGDWVPLASGLPGVAAAVPLHADAVLLVARPAAGAVLRLPEAPAVHLFVALGSVDVEGAGRLEEGDAARMVDGGRLLTAPSGAELLAWAMNPRR
ncbi:MAG: pirin family protein [Nocardioidaceae bacterium]